MSREPNQANALQRIVIVGGGSAGWMTAAALSSMLGGLGTSIELVESDAIGTVGVGEATIPDMLNFNRMLGIDEAEFMAATDATFKLGIEFVNWGKVGERYFHPFGKHGVDMQGIDFHQYWLAAQNRGHAEPIERYSMSAHAAYAGKFVHPNADPKSPRSHIRYAYHFDATRYAAYLRRYAEANGVVRTEGRVSNVGLNAESGAVERLTLDDGRAVEGDFFFDCTGFRALLMRGALGTKFRDWSEWLPCDSAQTVACEHNGPVPPYTRATARDAGWQWRIPTQKRTGNGHLYCSDFISDQDAQDVLVQSLDGAPLGEPRKIAFKTGCLETFWEKNVVGIGLSSGFLEPLESTSLYLIQTGISKFISLFPTADTPRAVVDEYNRQMRTEFEQVRDFIILHYKTTQRDDTPFWRRCRDMDIPNSLSRKIELFREAGRIFRDDDELFTRPSWVAVMVGQNMLPERVDPMVAQLPPAQIEHSLASMRAGMMRAADALPVHAAYLAQFTQHAKRSNTHAA